MLDHTLLSVKSLVERARTIGAKDKTPRKRRGEAAVSVTPAVEESQNAWNNALQFAVNSQTHYANAKGVYDKLRGHFHDAIFAQDMPTMEKAVAGSAARVAELEQMVAHGRKATAPFLGLEVPPDLDVHMETAMRAHNNVFGLYQDASKLHKNMQIMRDGLKRKLGA